MPPSTFLFCKPHRRLTPAVLAVACLSAAAGCGEAKPDRVAVHPAAGTLTVKGQPAHGAFVTLYPKSAPTSDVPLPRASVERDGSFQFSTFDGADGAPEGEYVVTVRWYKLVKSGPDAVAGPNVIPPKYTRPQSSDLTVRIAAGANSLPPIKL